MVSAVSVHHCHAAGLGAGSPLDVPAARRHDEVAVARPAGRGFLLSGDVPIQGVRAGLTLG
jgi:hypothetical protein